MLYTIRTLDADGCDVYADDVQGLKAAKLRAVEMLNDPETRDIVVKVEILDNKLINVWDKFAEDTQS